jgi:hypothetical protein
MPGMFAIGYIEMAIFTAGTLLLLWHFRDSFPWK